MASELMRGILGKRKGGEGMTIEEKTKHLERVTILLQRLTIITVIYYSIFFVALGIHVLTK